MTVNPEIAPARILEAARAEFVEKGFAGARMTAIAKAAGVNHALLHYYFGNKEKLHQAAVSEIVQTVWGGIKAGLQQIPENATFEQLLRALLKGHARVIAQHPEFVLFLFRNVNEGKGIPAGITEVLEHFGEIPRRIHGALRAEIEAGRLRPIAPEHFWLNLMGMALSGFFASQMLRHFPQSPLPLPRFDEAFFLERADVIADTMVRSLRPDDENKENKKDQEHA